MQTKNDKCEYHCWCSSTPSCPGILFSCCPSMRIVFEHRAPPKQNIFKKCRKIQHKFQILSEIWIILMGFKWFEQFFQKLLSNPSDIRVLHNAVGANGLLRRIQTLVGVNGTSSGASLRRTTLTLGQSSK